MKTLEDINLSKYNRHWKKGFFYGFGKKREIFQKLTSFIDKRQIVQIVGLRRVGKTTLFLQLIDNLIKKATDRFHILYFTFDEEKPSLDRLFKDFNRYTETDFKKEKIYVFLDEIQKLPNFQNQLKIYYDLYPNIKFFISGSSSLFVKKKTEESLTGRIFSFNLLPLSFKEYLFFKEKQGILKKPLVFKNEIEAEFEIYLTSQFIESIFFKTKEDRREYFNSIVRKIVFEDIPLTFKVENPEILWRIVKIIAQRPGIIINYQSLASDLGISNKTVSLYLYFLEKSFLVRKLYNFSRNLLTSEKKLKKYYLASPSFSHALADFQEIGFLAENFIVSLTDYKFFYRDVYKNEVDFVFLEKEKPIPLEIKYRKTFGEKEKGLLFRFMNKFKVKKGFVLWKNFVEKKEKLGDKKIIFKPIFNFVPFFEKALD